jgi:hypothetical protein
MLYNVNSMLLNNWHTGKEISLINLFYIFRNFIRRTVLKESLHIH